MAFSGKYELESQENYEQFLEATGLSDAKTDCKVITEVVQDGNVFSWTQSIPTWSWTNNFTVGQECELVTMTGTKFTAPVNMEEGKLSIQFPDYHLTAYIEKGKLVMTCVTREKGVTFTRVSRPI
ncbi:gastrotropin-like [Synchiropus splendidus]|uniref:gastrotropin-like n=1 Tax=Synchiropus splendidus TaxID=270530 RepID=UPI00237E4E85|nr:gastrotropin-like [Synchiropus splendidus]